MTPSQSGRQPRRPIFGRSRRLSVVVFTAANLNAIDGSSIWAKTITLALADIERVNVSILLTHSITTDRVIGPLLEHSRVRVIDPFSDGLTEANDPLPLDEAARIISELNTKGNKAVVVRGSAAARRLAQEPSLVGALIPYLTDLPQKVDDIDESVRSVIDEIMSASLTLLCQTEELMAFLELHFNSVRDKTWLLPPTIPTGLKPNPLLAPTRNELSLCYSGKFASQWNTLEMCSLPRKLANQGVATQLTMIGDKINKDPNRPEFVQQMRHVLKTSPGVEWVGGVTHEKSLRLMSESHIGLSWRDSRLDDSLELSTKLLEYCAVATPPLLNRTSMHEQIFGVAYPLFVRSEQDVVDLLQTLVETPDLWGSALAAIADISHAFTLDKTTARLESLFNRIFPM